VPPTLLTHRLELRPFAPEDVEELLDLFTDVDVRRYLLDDQVVTRDWVQAEVTASVERFASGSAGLWALRERGSAAIVGFAGFRPFFDPPELQLLYGLLPAYWGRGLATAAARAAIEHAFGTLGLDEVRAATDLPNSASIAVLERLDFVEWRRTDDGGHGTIFFRSVRSGPAFRTT